MATNPKALTRILQNIIRNGLYVSLHAGEPSTSGTPAIFGPERIPRNALTTVNGLIYNPQLISITGSGSGGRATHIGIWLDRSTFWTSNKLPSSVLIGSSTTIEIPRNKLQVKILDD